MSQFPKSAQFVCLPRYSNKPGHKPTVVGMRLVEAQKLRTPKSGVLAGLVDSAQGCMLDDLSSTDFCRLCIIRPRTKISSNARQGRR